MSVNPVRFGATGSDDTALFLKEYLGAFNAAPRSSVFLYEHNVPGVFRKNVTQGKSFQHLMFADLPEGEDFTPGDEMTGQPFAIDEGTITPDKYLVEHTFIPRDQMKFSHFDIMNRLAPAHKLKLQRKYDRRIMTLAAKAARSTSAVTKNGLNVHNGGNRVTRTGGAVATAFPTSTTGAANFRANLRSLGRQMDEDNIAPGPQNRGVLFTPYIKEVLGYDSGNAGSIFDRDFVDVNDGNSITRMEVNVLEGFRVLGTPNTTTNNGPLPDQNITADLTKYQGNFTVQAADGTPVALALCNAMDMAAAVGVITFEQIQHVVQYYPEKMAWLIASFVLCGADQMNPYCAGSIEVIT